MSRALQGAGDTARPQDGKETRRHEGMTVRTGRYNEHRPASGPAGAVGPPPGRTALCRIRAAQSGSVVDEKRPVGHPATGCLEHIREICLLPHPVPVRADAPMMYFMISFVPA